ncbi:GNAT family N-acetyltransferase [Vineibacter terrae]|uniref:GNAT family N-acetyltransferase n=1 Tax=Vineibacter terrae TaxID=2586908 RepID=A0A5C8PRU1_9HYPH|nr:GNAT family N-acetyltransferase [Vineibacter terrae]TXL78102.1 GNAT family N-acetyltransferase [Vineibacter terrae]
MSDAPRGRGLSVRRATIEDAEALAEMAQGLNAHQGDPVSSFSPAAARRDGFGEAPCWTALIAERDGRPVGYAMFHAAYDAPHAARGLYLQDLFVNDGERRQGVGRALMTAVAREARQAGCIFFWWTAKQWNTEALAFYRKLGAMADTVVAHALFGEAFDQLIDGDTTAVIPPPPARHGSGAGSDGQKARSAPRTRPRTRAR